VNFGESFIISIREFFEMSIQKIPQWVFLLCAGMTGRRWFDVLGLKPPSRKK